MELVLKAGSFKFVQKIAKARFLIANPMMYSMTICRMQRSFPLVVKSHKTRCSAPSTSSFKKSTLPSIKSEEFTALHLGRFAVPSGPVRAHQESARIGGIDEEIQIAIFIPQRTVVSFNVKPILSKILLQQLEGGGIRFKRFYPTLWI